MNKEIRTSPALTEDPYLNLGVLEPSQIIAVDPTRSAYQLAKDSLVLIEGIRNHAAHEYLAKIQLQEELLVTLESVGRNVRNPNSPTNVIGTFKYGLGELSKSAKHLRNRSFGDRPLWALQPTPVEMFLARQNYFIPKTKGRNLARITDIHIIANLTQDPRLGIRNPSKNFRFRHWSIR